MIIYYVLTTIIFVVTLPILMLYIKFTNQAQRLTWGYKKYYQCLWIHAASMGEVNGIRQLIARLRRTYPNREIVITTMTKTGRKVARELADAAYLAPLDLFPILLRGFRFLQPAAIIIAETEIWPGMITMAHKKGIPLVFINARISDSSLGSYQKLKPLLAPVFRHVHTVIAQSEKDQQRFISLGFRDVRHTGNLKFSVTQPLYRKEDMRKEMGFAQDDLVVVWGSSRPGEEQLALTTFDALKQRHPRLHLILVPRHLKRLPEIRTILNGHDVTYYSSYKPGAPIVVVDAMGVLQKLYALCDIAVVGGSFFDFGGHNPLEPAFYRCPIIMGPYHSSCRDSVEKLKQGNGIIIANTDTLQDEMQKLLVDSLLRNRIGNNAKNVLEAHASSVDDTTKILQNIIAESL